MVQVAAGPTLASMVYDLRALVELVVVELALLVAATMVEMQLVLVQGAVEGHVLLVAETDLRDRSS
jgi:hypothetical protein